jgi:hypothetical protein
MHADYKQEEEGGHVKLAAPARGRRALLRLLRAASARAERTRREAGLEE